MDITTPPQPTGIISEGDPCCQHCTALDLDNLLQHRDRLTPSTHIPLSQPHAASISPESPCPFCRLLAAIRPAASNTSSPADDELEIIVESAGFYGTSMDGSGAELSSGERPVNPTILWLGNLRRQEDLGYLGHDGPGFVFSLTQGRQVPGINPQVRFRSATMIDFGLLRGWLRECQELHADFCGLVYKESALPQMLIDCEARCLVRSADVGDKTPYLALSYVWGKPTTADPEPKVEYPDLPYVLPLTIEDAIAVTRNLDFRYLWIDRYCIDQADPIAKMAEIGRMDLIYQNATATIIASGGFGPDHGLPGVSTRARPPQPRERVGGYDLVTSMQNPVTAVRSSTWMTRGWTHQEALLSRRRLFFIDEQVYFECYTARSSEIVPLSLAVADGKNMGTYMHGVFQQEAPEGLAGLAFLTIDEYSNRTLSFQSDALNAVDGIMRYYENNSAIRSYWGVPILPPADSETDADGDTDSAHADARDDLPADGYHLTRGLCWTEGPALDVEADMLHYRRLYYRRLVCGQGVRRAGFPSWSWAGWQGAVDYRWTAWHDMELRNREAADVDIEVELRDGSLVDWAGFVATATAADAGAGGLFADTALHSQYIHVTAPSFTIPLRYFTVGQRFPATETVSRHDYGTNRHLLGADVCEYDGIYACFGEGKIYGYYDQDASPEECEWVVRINHFLPVREVLKNVLEEAEKRKCAQQNPAASAEFFGILIGPRERMRPSLFLDYAVGIPAERERECPVEYRDFVMVVRVVERCAKDDDIFVVERIGSLDGQLLTGFASSYLKAIETRRFRLG
ncbi:heterokaryon incompatibility protein-domain-containing protein [Lasiosphaeria hispida]|uniref:Heterokaryon incompatibility protein-domain-containing protein n=1 Tax=Lasiosphaeria hispida TaxID=260671 RepID=A0AAJ0H7S8_9PEZI|nr:heterokaryon incompatibility protein-domain-containing protein [Lasiosphaeria hispida]